MDLFLLVSFQVPFRIQFLVFNSIVYWFVTNYKMFKLV